VSITRRSLFGFLAAAPVALPAAAEYSAYEAYLVASFKNTAARTAGVKMSSAYEAYESLCANIRIDEQMGVVQPSDVAVYLDGTGPSFARTMGNR
jgi:hypothetical protein